MALKLHEQDRQVAMLAQQLHSNPVKSQGLFAMRKVFKVHRVVLDTYYGYFGKDTEEDDKIRQVEYTTMVKHGLGQPARETAKFTDAGVTGLNNSDYQIQKATLYTKQAGLSQDEIFRVMKPGGVSGVYEWLLTDKFDEENPEHREIVLGIQQGNGRAGFEILHHDDLADRPAWAPWYYPLTFSKKNVRSLSDLITYAPMSRWGRTVTHYLTGILEAARILPRRTQVVADSLAFGGECLVAAGEKGLFIPMYLMVARKLEVRS
ncbi:sterol methyltransferase C-terminal-domain-containing protein [Aspergillus aurantiobrunneus]